MIPLKNFVYYIPAGDYFDHEPQACFLVYSPLKLKSFLALPAEVERIRELLESEHSNDELFKTLLPETSVYERYTSVIIPEMTSMQLLLNERCNFNCSYCYSAGSRSDTELSIAQIESALKFIHECAKKHSLDTVSVTFIGGGEPMLSWDLVTATVHLSQKLAAADSIKTKWVLVTNGSIFSDAQIEFCCEHNFEIQFSFEILERIQNLQRKSFNLVSSNLKKVLAAGANVYIRSTITEDNVDLLPEMAAECLKEYPGVSVIGCEPVSDPLQMTDPQKAKAFYDRYFASYQAACNLLAGTKLTLSSSSSRVLHKLRRRFCGPMFVVSPEGELISCAHYSSREMPEFQNFHYGSIKNEQINISSDKFKTIYPDELPVECQNCWARWNCGGGCPNQRLIYNTEVFNVICDARKQILRHELLRVIGEQYTKTTGKDFKSTISKMLDA